MHCIKPRDHKAVEHLIYISFYMTHLHLKPLINAPGSIISSSVSSTQRQDDGLGPFKFPNSWRYTPSTYQQRKCDRGTSIK